MIDTPTLFETDNAVINEIRAVVKRKNPRKITASKAEFSIDGKHRLSLYREWDINKPSVMFIGLNPSTANATSDDPTIRRVIAMADSWGFGSVYMMNLFTFISTDPKKLNIKNGNLPESNTRLIESSNKCTCVVFAWGNFEVMGRDKEVKKMYPYAMALHINKNGSPKHPLYVKSDTQLIRFNQQ